MRKESLPISTDQSLSNSSFIVEEQVRLLYVQAPISNSVIIIISLLYYFLLQPRLDTGQLLLWLVLLLITASYRLYLWYHRKNGMEARSPESWLNRYLLGCGLVGCSWSLIYPLLYGTDDPFVMAALLMLAFGIISSAIPILSSYIPAFIVYAYPQGLALIVTLLCFDNTAYSWLAVAVGVYLSMMTLFIRNTNRSILQAIRLQEQNTALIEDLNNEISQREALIAQRTLELKEKNRDLIFEIKDRECTEERLQRANADLDATLRAIPDALFELDENGKYLDLWAQDAKILVARKEMLIGRRVHEVLPAEAVCTVMTAIREAAETGNSHGQIIKLSLKHGECWFELSTSRKQRTNSSSHFLMLSRDITEKRRMEAELLKIQQLESVGVLAGGIAHDFNNILSAILGNIELVASRVKEDTKAVTLLLNAQKATKRAAKLTHQLLTFSKGGDPVKETTFLPKLIVDSADFVLHGSPVSCHYTFQEGLWAVNVDSGQVSQVIQNIILNAKHAMPEGGKINICCHNVMDAASEPLLCVDGGHFVRITVEDTGVGISPEIIDKIFDPYFTTNQKGSGLGLAICHSIINKHDGYIRVQSTPAEGTIFTIYLMAELSADTTVAEQQGLDPVVKTARILVMDDDEMIRITTEELLSFLGHEVLLVVDGEQAVSRYRELKDLGTPVDLVIMDLTIPGGMGGQEAAQQLLNFDPEAKIIVASGYSNDPVMASYRDYGFSAAVTKPFDLDELKKGVDSALS